MPRVGSSSPVARGFEKPLWQLKLARFSSAYRARLLSGALCLCSFLRGIGHFQISELMRRRSLADDVLRRFVEHTCASPVPRALRDAKHAVLFCQAVWPRLRHNLPETWAALRLVEDMRPRGVRTPLPLPLLLAMVIAARARGMRVTGRSRFKWLVFAALLEVAFFAMLRPCELFGLRAAEVSTLNSLSLGFPHCTLRIAHPKNRRALGPAQFVVVTHPCACMWLTFFVNGMQPQEFLWGPSPQDFRARFHTVAASLGLGHCRFTPASLRAGGASYWYQSGMPIASLKFLGRWASEATLAHYVQFATAQQILLRVPDSTSQYLRSVLLQGFFLLEPSSEVRRGLREHQRIAFRCTVPLSAEQVSQALHEYGQLEAAVPAGGRQGRAFGGSTVLGCHR